jgi:hypothetical protein
VAKFLNERFVAVRIEDKKDDLFAAVLGLCRRGIRTSRSTTPSEYSGA